MGEVSYEVGDIMGDKGLTEPRDVGLSLCDIDNGDGACDEWEFKGDDVTILSNDVEGGRGDNDCVLPMVACGGMTGDDAILLELDCIGSPLSNIQISDQAAGQTRDKAYFRMGSTSVAWVSKLENDLDRGRTPFA